MSLAQFVCETSQQLLIDIFRTGLQLLRPENQKADSLFVLIPLLPFPGISYFFNRCYALQIHGTCDVYLLLIYGPCGFRSHGCVICIYAGCALFCSSVFSVITREYISCALSWLIAYSALALLLSRRWIDIDSRHVLGELDW